MITIYLIEQYVSTTTATHIAQTKKTNDISKNSNNTNTTLMNTNTTFDAFIKIDNEKNTSSRNSNIEKQNFIMKVLIEIFVKMNIVYIIITSKISLI